MTRSFDGLPEGPALLEGELDGMTLIEGELDGMALLEGEFDGIPEGWALVEGELDGMTLLEGELDRMPEGWAVALGVSRPPLNRRLRLKRRPSSLLVLWLVAPVKAITKIAIMTRDVAKIACFRKKWGSGVSAATSFFEVILLKT
jgi:hypothetical protein